MKLSRYASIGLAVAGSIALSTLAFAAGLFPDFPVVGSATYCAGSSSTATGTIIGAITGCPNQVPAGPTIVTGNEQIPADTRLASGAQPQTVLVPMASLNALPITVQTVTGGSITNISAANTSGGAILTSAQVAITSVNITLPASPIDGQQYALSFNRNASFTIAAGGTNSLGAGSTVSSMVNVVASGIPIGYRFLFNSASTSWFRLQ